MYDVDFMSDVEYCMKYGINPAAFALGKSESQTYWGLCHELLHAILHEVMGEKVCIALDNITEFNERTPDGKNAFIWIGDDPEKASV
jgi:hypothetical protein